MKTAGALTVGVADLLRRTGGSRHEHLETVLDGLAVTGSRVPDGAPVTVDVGLDAINEGVVVKGTVTAPWTGECRRCLTAVERRLSVPVLEVYEEHPTEGETRPLHHDHLDLEPLVRETVLLELPMAPLCRSDCAGLCPECGADRNVEDCGHALAVHDDRWAALDRITFDD